ncbi:hypothetical protein GCM10011332_28000 [Terasakiella brassicae]|uniref:Methyltransferase type 11 domain-containing protein n=1 Tax=Terasakiella brassicae TaxID=1634917 RepID=A0A917C7F9_9PROT|nr:class I SAM-dependent methyltransferase [Terasakiella brassicae]GGF72432.1 hypothetical protein GCM10011332_28000 [Terasakiella brassicae]
MSNVFSSELTERLSHLHQLIFDASYTCGELQHTKELFESGHVSEFDLVYRMMLSTEFYEKSLSRSIENHLYCIHSARIKMIHELLPDGDIILDLGGANAPLYRMGYKYNFKKLTLVDLPEDERHELYGNVSLDSEGVEGEVVIHYSDMTNLAHIPDNSVDFVWSGQSIEHIPAAAGIIMCEEAFRVLKPGGHFCLDTPNRLITEIHTATVGGGFIHPEHFLEYTPAQLRKILLDTNFTIQDEYGICEMPVTAKTKEFDYKDFIRGNAISRNMDDCYIQYFHCRKL